MHTTSQLLSLCGVVLLLTFPVFRFSTSEFDVIPELMLTQQEVSVTPFNSIETHDGVKAILQYGPTNRVTLVKGSQDYTQITIVNGRLIVNKCKGRCPRGYELEMHIVTPHIARVSVFDGGTIQSVGTFPSQSAIALAVSNGGNIDVRSIAADAVSAAVAEGGGIYTRPQSAMTASIVNGGIITYWGDAAVTKSVRGGGAVTKGKAGDVDKPISDFNPETPPLPPVPAVPVIRSQQ